MPLTTSQSIDSRNSTEENLAMPESLVLRNMLADAEARLAERRQYKLTVDVKKAEVEEEERRVDEEIATMESVAKYIRGVLAAPVVAVPNEGSVAPFARATSHLEIVRTMPVKVTLRAGSKRDQVFSVLQELDKERGAPVPRREILVKCVEGGFMGHEQEPDVALTNILSYFKHHGLATTDNRGNWSVINWNAIRKE